MFIYLVYAIQQIISGLLTSIYIKETLCPVYFYYICLIVFIKYLA